MFFKQEIPSAPCMGDNAYPERRVMPFIPENNKRPKIEPEDLAARDRL